MKEIILYRHKTNKDYYLVRNWSICGGNPDTNWFEATDSIYKAIRESKNYAGKFIKEAFEDRPFQNEDELKAKIEITKEFEFDGYKGNLTKELVFNVSDFEEIHLVIKEDLESQE